ncbi:MAG: tetratricopeptide repeat protein [Chitinophagaceae bacterium]|nr:tetratricopeptide repeat protein [Chitinophagaceae bacterium]
MMNNKKAILVASVLGITFGAQAQSVEEGIKMLHYERYETAQKILQPLAAANPRANYYLGLAQLGDEKKDAARATFLKFPEDAANIAGLARIDFAEGKKTEGTTKALEAAAKAKKKDWEPQKFAADALSADGGNPTMALEYYNKAIEKAPENLDLKIAFGDAAQQLDNGGGKAMSSYENVIAKDPKNSLAYSRIGKLWYAARKYDSALVNYARAKDADPTNPLPYRDLANAYFYVGKYELAKQNSDEYLKRSDNSAEDKIQHANLLFLSKHYPEAIKEMQDLISAGIEKPYMYRIIGYSQSEINDSANALINMDKFFAKQDPKKVLPSDYMYYAKILSQNGKVEESDTYYNKAVATDTSKDKSELYRQIAEGFVAQKNEQAYAKAGEWYGKIAVENPNTKALDYFNWGLYKYYGKQYADAAKAFAAMRAKYPEQPSAPYWQGRVAAAIDNEGKNGDALPFFNDWLNIPDTKDYTKKGPDLNKAYQYLALYYYNKGDKAQTQVYIDKISAIDPNDAFVKQLKDAITPKKAAVKGK